MTFDHWYVSTPDAAFPIDEKQAGAVMDRMNSGGSMMITTIWDYQVCINLNVVECVYPTSPAMIAERREHEYQLEQQIKAIWSPPYKDD